ncbi:phospholipid methyltransferase [Aureococcus anophagefferens]|nr:phospholipid methyltransferase [Aureococcus anophagefferens]
MAATSRCRRAHVAQSTLRPSPSAASDARASRRRGADDVRAARDAAAAQSGVRPRRARDAVPHHAAQLHGRDGPDTGDAAGDAHFGLYEKSAPVVCDAKLNPRHAENILCENDALLQIPGFNVYIAVEVEMDDRCRCDAVETLSVGREFPKFGKPLPPAGYPEICYADFYPIEGYRNNKTAFKTLDNVSLADCCARARRR